MRTRVSNCDTPVIFAPVRGLLGCAIECCQLHFSPTDSHCHGMVTQMIFAVLENWYHHIVFTHSCKLVSFLHIYLLFYCQKLGISLTHAKSAIRIRISTFDLFKAEGRPSRWTSLLIISASTVITIKQKNYTNKNMHLSSPLVKMMNKQYWLTTCSDLFIVIHSHTI